MWPENVAGSLELEVRTIVNCCVAAETESRSLHK